MHGYQESVKIIIIVENVNGQISPFFHREKKNIEMIVSDIVVNCQGFFWRLRFAGFLNLDSVNEKDMRNFM